MGGFLFLLVILGLLVVCWPVIVGLLYAVGWFALIVAIPAFLLLCAFAVLAVFFRATRAVWRWVS